MKKIVLVISLIFLLIGCGCEQKDNAKKSAIRYLNQYVNLDQKILKQLDDIVEQDDLSESQENKYQDVLKRQYKNLKYEIVSEEYEKDDAVVTVDITVYDLYKVQKEAEEYMIENKDDFDDPNGNYDRTKFLDYKLSKMIDTEETKDYKIDLFITYKNEEWIVLQPSNVVLEKIHGIYNYNNK